MISESGKENFDWTGTRTQDLWITVPALSHLSYPALWMAAVPKRQLFFAGVGGLPGVSGSSPGPVKDREGL